jgi:hypothetical protein
MRACTATRSFTLNAKSLTNPLKSVTFKHVTLTDLYPYGALQDMGMPPVLNRSRCHPYFSSLRSGARFQQLMQRYHKCM